jgi:hypothetical protein
VLSTHEQQVWDDIERYYVPPSGEATAVGGLVAGQQESAVPTVDDLPVTVLGGAMLAIMLVIFGEVTTGLVLGAATVLGWLLWRYGWQLAAADSAAALPVDGEEGPAGAEPRGSAGRTRNPRWADLPDVG